MLEGILLLIERGEGGSLIYLTNRRPGSWLGPDEGGYETARAGQLRTWSLKKPPPGYKVHICRPSEPFTWLTHKKESTGIVKSKFLF